MGCMFEKRVVKLEEGAGEGLREELTFVRHANFTGFTYYLRNVLRLFDGGGDKFFELSS